MVRFVDVRKSYGPQKLMATVRERAPAVIQRVDTVLACRKAGLRLFHREGLCSRIPHSLARGYADDAAETFPFRK